MLYYCSELMFLPRVKGVIKMSAVDNYIKAITELLKKADLELLDFTFQFLQKSVEQPPNPLKERQLSA